MIETIHAIPGSATLKRVGSIKIKSELIHDHNLLQSENYQHKKAKELYNFLISNLPAGIFHAFMKIIIKEDLGCNNYYAEILGLDQETLTKYIRKAGVL